MKNKKNSYSFNRDIISVNNHLNIYIRSSSEEDQFSVKAETSQNEGTNGTIQEKETETISSFFGHHICTIFDPIPQSPLNELRTIEEELESSYDIVRKKLAKKLSAQSSQVYKKNSVTGNEEMKHLQFIEERNYAQEALFKDILLYHQKFGTGLTYDKLFSLHDLMKKEAVHEKEYSRERSLHESVECNTLLFLRRKAGERAWQKLEEYMTAFKIPFPISSAMIDPAEPLRNEKISEEAKKSSQDDFLNMPANRLAELVLGNVPVWVYSYPAQDTYLWKLTVLRGVAAGLAAQYLMHYLSVWENNSTEILHKIKNEFMDEIQEIRLRSEAAVDLSAAHRISTEIQLIIKEKIPEHIWYYMSSKVEFLSPLNQSQ
jgi:hypothetical protein